MSYLYQVLFYEPTLNLLVWLYNVVPGHDFGVAIIILTILVRILLWPLTWKTIVSQKKITALQPKIDKLKQTHKNNKEELGRAMMKLYSEEKVNPFTSCLPILIQLPFMFALFQVFNNTNLSKVATSLYAFIEAPQVFNTLSMIGGDLVKPNIYLALLAGALQFWQSKLSLPTPKKDQKPGEVDMQAMMQKQMVYMAPVLTIVFGAALPGALALHWAVSALLMCVQQLYIQRNFKSN